MKFGNPPMLNLLWITLPLLVFFFWWTWRKRKKDMTHFVRSRLLAHLTVGVSPARQKSRLALLTLAVGCIILALAHPQWGYRLEEVKQKGLDIVVALDTSRSMLAEDVTPNRLTRAKLAALELMPLAKTDRLGLVAFAGTAFLQCPLTIDDAAFRQGINALDTSVIPQGGTAIAEAIRTSLTAFKNDEENERVLVLITDGEDHEEGVVEAAEAAAKMGVHIFTIGVGTPQGEVLRVKDAKGATAFFKDEEGNAVKSRLNEALLRQVASIGHGFFLQMRGANTMDLLYERGLEPLLGQVNRNASNRAAKSEPRLIKEFQERFQWPLGLAILLLLAELFLPERTFGRRAERLVTPPIALTRQTVIGVLLLALTQAALHASPAKALQLYKEGKYEEAWREYQRLMNRNPKDSRLAFNAGASAYQAKEYEQAAQQFNEAVTASDLQLQERSFYNLGNSLYRLGETAQDPAKKQESWEQSLKSYESALKLNAQDPDAKFNLEYVKKKLEELKKQQEQQKNQQKQNQDNKDNKDNKENKENKDKQDSKDQSKQDQSQQKQGDDQQKQPTPKPDDKNKSDQAKNQSKDGQKKPEDSAASQKNQKPENKGVNPQETNAPAAVAEGQMTREQAQQLLDAQKSEEKALLFIPRDIQTNHSRIFKDW